ncbi:VOC family protein [bacterium]|nr:VOC family protein [bacterium]
MAALQQLDDPNWRDPLRTITLYLLVRDGRAQISFIEQVFGGKLTMCEEDDGRVRHAQVQIGDSIVMLGEASGDFAAIPGAAYIYVEDVDACHAKALALGADEVYPPAEQDYGDYCAGIRDPQGTSWWVARAR